METLAQYHTIIGTTVARLFLGFLFFFQGYDAIFNIGMQKVVLTYRDGFGAKRIPRFLIVLAAWFTAYTEFICGFLLIVGLFQFPAMYLLGLNLIVAAIGFGINLPLWDTRHVLPRLLLLLLLLLVPLGWHQWTIDYLIF
ncbi:MAG: DoxX family membrane protein [Bacteroidota bacterium]